MPGELSPQPRPQRCASRIATAHEHRGQCRHRRRERGRRTPSSATSTITFSAILAIRPARPEWTCSTLPARRAPVEDRTTAVTGERSGRWSGWTVSPLPIANLPCSAQAPRRAASPRPGTCPIRFSADRDRGSHAHSSAAGGDGRPSDRRRHPRPAAGLSRVSQHPAAGCMGTRSAKRRLRHRASQRVLAVTHLSTDRSRPVAQASDCREGCQA